MKNLKTTFLLFTIFLLSGLEAQYYKGTTLLNLGGRHYQSKNSYFNSTSKELTSNTYQKGELTLGLHRFVSRNISLSLSLNSAYSKNLGVKKGDSQIIENKRTEKSWFAGLGFRYNLKLYNGYYFFSDFLIGMTHSKHQEINTDPFYAPLSQYRVMNISFRNHTGILWQSEKRIGVSLSVSLLNISKDILKYSNYPQNTSFDNQYIGLGNKRLNVFLGIYLRLKK